MMKVMDTPLHDGLGINLSIQNFKGNIFFHCGIAFFVSIWLVIFIFLVDVIQIVLLHSIKFPYDL
jgi:hypothetical protein